MIDKENLFLIPLWKRPDITRICLETLIHFKQQVLCICSRVEDSELCCELDIPYCWHPNEQLGAKWNHGLLHSHEMEWKYLVTLGSDDIIKESLFDLYKSEEDIIITDKINFIDIPTGRASLIVRARIGAGRRISRKVIEKCNYKLWTDSKNRSLDMDSNATINRAGFATIELNTKAHIVGLKSEVNIWGYEHTLKHGLNISMDAALSGVPLCIRHKILSLLPEQVKRTKFVSNILN